MPRRDNRSGFRGAMSDSGDSQKWISRLRINGTALYLGHFRSPEKASRFYLIAREFFMGGNPCR